MAGMGQGMIGDPHYIVPPSTNQELEDDNEVIIGDGFYHGGAGGPR